MADRVRDLERSRARQAGQNDGRPLTASAQILTGAAREQYALQYRTWQDELWAYTDTVGEFGSVVNWFAAGMSRMHLIAARWKPGLTEPEPITEGPAAELVQNLVLNAEGGESQYLRNWAKQLLVPGVGYFVGEDLPDLGRVYDVKSADVIKRSGKPNKDPRTGRPMPAFEIQVAPDMWRKLGNESLVGRIFDPDPRWDYLPTSMTKGAITTLREIDLYNRAIVATLLSRIAFNGILLIPEEVTFPVNPQFKDAPDPFIAELLHFAQRGIKDPGSPGAAIPFPLRVNSNFIEKFKHLILSSGLDPKIIEARKSAVERLAEQLPAPPEAMTGLSDVNHWNAASISNDNIKLYFSPPMEVLCGGLTKVFLRPMLLGSKQKITDDEGNRIVMWYDSSDLAKQPDNSENATNAHERIVISDDAYRAVVGFDEEDAPDDEQRRTQILTQLARTGSAPSEAYYLLYPKDKPAEPVLPQTPGGVTKPDVGPSSGNVTPPRTMPQTEPPAGA